MRRFYEVYIDWYKKSISKHKRKMRGIYTYKERDFHPALLKRLFSLLHYFACLYKPTADSVGFNRDERMRSLTSDAVIASNLNRRL